MQGQVAMTHVRQGMYRLIRFVAWLMTVVTFFAVIGQSFSTEKDTHTIILLGAVFGASVGVLLLLPNSLHLKYQKIIAMVLLLVGIIVGILV